MAKASPRARQERAVIKPGYPLSAVSGQLPEHARDPRTARKINTPPTAIPASRSVATTAFLLENL